MRLYQAFPQPSPVTLGGRRYLALPLRVRHLAAIETFIAARVPNPAEAYRERIAAAEDGDERRLLAARAYLRSEDWPPRPESPEGERAMLTPLGLKLLLGFTVEPVRPLEPDDVERIVNAITPAEYMGLLRVAYGLGWSDELAIAIQPPQPGPPDRAKTWGEILHDISDGRPSELIAAADLFVTQVSLLRSGGKAGDGVIPATTQAERADRRRLFAEARKLNQAEDAEAADGGDE